MNPVSLPAQEVFIRLENLSIDFPIYQDSARSLRRQIFRGFRGRVDEERGKTIVHSLRQLTLSIHKGERVGLLGANGAGKSTLLRVMSLIYPPTQGSIEVQGRISSLLNISLGIDPELSGLENLQIRGIMMGLSPEQVRELLPEVVEFADLEEFIALPMRTYSDGMRLRLLFSMATAIRTDILLLDEWLSAGDQQFQKKAQMRMDQLTDQAAILVLASHSTSLLKRACSRGIWLDKGRIIMDGPIAEVCAAYEQRN